ncbi:MAG: uroporphyrinogen decarboxylase family protein [Candidatus Omnitrophica bacterium]|nr:uroporphyrinogen decarboxylase family protein [Candidatus Omnitrophota bacterium]
MTHKERFVAALNHREPDKVPFDFGGHQSGIHKIAYGRLNDYLGIDIKAIEINEKVQQLAEIDENILRRLKVDSRYVYPATKILQEDNPYVDAWGVKRLMPEGGLYYDMIKNLLSSADIKEIEEYKGPVAEELGITKELAEKGNYLYENTNYALVTTFPGIFEKSWELRGVENILMDIALNQKLVETLFDKVLEIEIKLYEKLLGFIGKFLNLVMFTEDLGHEDGLLVSPQFYRKVLKPRQKELIKTIKRYSNAKVAIHSDGAIRSLLEDFIEIGIDVINPVQAGAKDMNTKSLKRDFGENYVSGEA